MARPLDGGGQVALMPRARAGLAAGPDLAALADKAAQLLGGLVVDLLGLLDAELAHLGTRRKFAAGATSLGPRPRAIGRPTFLARRMSGGCGRTREPEFQPLEPEVVPDQSCFTFPPRQPIGAVTARSVTQLKWKLFFFGRSHFAEQVFPALALVAQHDHLVGDNLGAIVLLAIGIFPTARLQAAIDVHRLAFA